MGAHFSVSQFWWDTLILVIIPTALVLLVTSRSNSEQNSGEAGVRSLLGIVAGFFSAAVWLTWNPTMPVTNIFEHGPPYDFATFQVVGCGLTLMVLSSLIAGRFGRSVGGLIGVSACVAAGFATAFSLATSNGDTAQEGIGIFLSYVGIGALTVVSNAVVLAVLEGRKFLISRGETLP